MAYVAITDASLETGDTLTQELIRQFRDNPESVRLGAVSAPRHKPYSLETYRQAASVNFSFLGYYVARSTEQVPAYEGGDSGRGHYTRTITVNTPVAPSTNVTVAKEADITDIAGASYCAGHSRRAGADRRLCGQTRILCVTPVDWSHPLGKRISRASFTLVMKNDPRSATEPKAVTGTMPYDIIYMRQNFWVPDDTEGRVMIQSFVKNPRIQFWDFSHCRLRSATPASRDTPDSRPSSMTGAAMPLVRRECDRPDRLIPIGRRGGCCRFGCPAATAGHELVYQGRGHIGGRAG